eukprot:sb/3463537/
MRSDQQIHHSKTNRRYVVYPLVGGISLLLLLPPYSMGDHCFSFTSTPSEDSHSTQHQDTGGALSPQPQTQPLRSAQNPLKNSAHNGNAKVGNGARNGNPAQILIKNSAQNGNAETGKGARKGKTIQNRPARKPNEKSAPTGNAQKGNVTESPKAHSFSICSLLGPTMAILIILLFATFVLAITGSENATSASPEYVTSNVEEECVCMIRESGVRRPKHSLTRHTSGWKSKQPIRTRYLGHVTYPPFQQGVLEDEVVLTDEEKEILGEETEPVDSKKDQTNKYTIPKLTEDLSDLLHYLSNQSPPPEEKAKREKDRKKAQIKQKRKLLSEKKKGQSSKTNPGNIDMGDLTNSLEGTTEKPNKKKPRKLQGDSTTAAKVPETAPRHPIALVKWVGTGEAGTGVQLKHDLAVRYYSSATSPPPPMRFISSRQVEEGVELEVTDDVSLAAVVETVKGLPDWEVVSTDRGKITIRIVGPGMNHGMGEHGLKMLLLSLNGEKPGPDGYPALSGAMRLLTWAPKLGEGKPAIGYLDVDEEFYSGVTARGLVTHQLQIDALIPGDVP